MVIRNIVRQLETPDRLRGRMTGVNMVFFMGGPQLGELEAGAVANWLGAPFSVSRRARLPARDRLGCGRDAGAAALPASRGRGRIRRIAADRAASRHLDVMPASRTLIARRARNRSTSGAVDDEEIRKRDRRQRRRDAERGREAVVLDQPADRSSIRCRCRCRRRRGSRRTRRRAAPA